MLDQDKVVLLVREVRDASHGKPCNGFPYLEIEVHLPSTSDQMGCFSPMVCISTQTLNRVCCSGFVPSLPTTPTTPCPIPTWVASTIPQICLHWPLKFQTYLELQYVSDYHPLTRLA